MLADLALYGLIALLVGAAWWAVLAYPGLTRGDTGYWVGVAGGVAMLLLFGYPMRKRVRALHRWGAAKWWFWAHMALGLGGPWLILVHSGFKTGSVNAAVAFYSMFIVAGSGVVGRFLFARVNQGLRGEADTLRELQTQTGLHQQASRSRLAFAPLVEAQLLAFEYQHTQPLKGSWAAGWRLLSLPWRQRQTSRACLLALRAPLVQAGTERDWNPAFRAQQQVRAECTVQRYLQGVAGVSRWAAYQRLFALWHVAHVPFVYLMVASAVAHVVAVHAY